MWSKFLNLKLSTLIVLQSAVIIGLFSIMATWLGWQTRDTIYAEKTTTTKNLVEIVHGLLTE